MAKTRGAPAKYPWDKWLKPGSRHKISRPKHFKSTTKTMIVYIYATAKKYGVKVKIRELSEGVLSIQAREA